MSERYDLKSLSLEQTPCRRCKLVEQRVQAAYERGLRHGTRAEHERHEALHEAEAHERLLAAVRARQASRERWRERLRLVFGFLGLLGLVLVVGELIA